MFPHTVLTEVYDCRTQMEGIEAKLERARQELSSLQSELIGPQSDEGMAKSIQGDVALLDQHQNELRRLDKEINKLLARLPKGGLS